MKAARMALVPNAGHLKANPAQAQELQRKQEQVRARAQEETGTAAPPARFNPD